MCANNTHTERERGGVGVREREGEAETNTLRAHMQTQGVIESGLGWVGGWVPPCAHPASG